MCKRAQPCEEKVRGRDGERRPGAVVRRPKREQTKDQATKMVSSKTAVRRAAHPLVWRSLG